MYGYQEEVKVNNKHFGLNEKVRLTRFEWINNAGKGQTEGEAIDISFTFPGDDKPVSFRQFPFNGAFDNKNHMMITDHNHPMFKKALQLYQENFFTILLCYMTREELADRMGSNYSSFKEFAKVLVSLLPKNFDQIDLDIMMQWQYRIKDGQNTTFLEVPKNVAVGGKFLCRHMEPVGKWTAVTDANGLRYVDADNNLHFFKRDAKWMNSNFAKQQTNEEPTVSADIFSAATTTTLADPVTVATPTLTDGGW